MADNAEKEKATWCGRPVLSENDCHELETAAAINEFDKKMPRPVAEETAYATYMYGKHLEASAHHLLGMKASHAAGKMDEARKHGKMYETHMKAAGLSHTGPVPQEVLQMMKDNRSSNVYKFRAHKADAFMQDRSAEAQPVAKSLTDRLVTLYTAAKQFLDLRKGDVIQFKPKAAPASSMPSEPKTAAPSKEPAPVTPLSPHIERNNFMDKAKARLDQGEPELIGKDTGKGGSHHRTFDYSHFLDDAHRFQGYKLMVHSYQDHNGFEPEKGKDALIGQLYHNGAVVGTAMGESSMHKLPSPGWLTGSDKHANTSRERSTMAAIRAHGDWAGYNRALYHVNGARDLFDHDK